MVYAYPYAILRAIMPEMTILATGAARLHCYINLRVLLRVFTCYTRYI